ncbi:hypothetical protein [Roseateles flavus]|uniref:Uncharacterized protein n=1 Tax=Roseateles flavus TaxID=3149041 RepID=A0ABV0GJ12_9BURK
MLRWIADHYRRKYAQLVQRNNHDRRDLPAWGDPVSWVDKVPAAVQLGVMPIVALGCAVLGWRVGGVGGVILLGLLGVPIGHLVGWIIGHLLTAVAQTSLHAAALLAALLAIGTPIGLAVLAFKRLWGLGID